MKCKNCYKKKNKKHIALTSTDDDDEKQGQPQTTRARRRPKKKNVSTGLNGGFWNTTPAQRQSNSSVVYRRIFTDESSSESLSMSCDDTDEKTLLYPKETFVTCRNPSDSFYLCQLLQDVHTYTKTIRIRWCSVIGEQGDDTQISINTRFQLTYEDKLDPETILLNIPELITHAPNVFGLRKQDLVATKRQLKKSIPAKSESSNDMMDLSTEIPTKKAKTSAKHIRFSSTSDDDSSSASQPEIPVTSRPRKRKMISRKTKPVRQPKTPRQPAKKRPRKSLNQAALVQHAGENLAVQLYDKEPFFEDNLPVPFISSLVQSKLAIRAVLTSDSKRLQSLIDDVHRVCSVHVTRALQSDLAAIHYAIQTNQITMLKMLLDDLKSPKKDRCPFPTVSMATQSTGRANIHTFGFRTAPLMASRGAKQGNNALNENETNSVDNDDMTKIVLYAVENNCSQEIFDLLFQTFPETHDAIYNNIHKIIRAGHRQLAAKIIGDIKDNIFHGFNYLHHQVLLYDQEDITVNRTVSVLKKARVNDQITPIHCAAINPNGKYLKQLLHLMPEYNILDRYERRPIHFAAACEGPEPLEYLLSKHVSFNDIDRGGNAPLHIAVTSGRAINAEILLRKAKENVQPNDTDDNDPTIDDKFGLASINRINKSFFYPLHLAVLNNHLNCVKVLLDFEANVDAVTSKAAKLTPLMLACQKGYSDIVMYLIDHGAQIQARDRFKRTPLIHACMCGNADIVAYLLRKGADANAADSSSNTALHYSMAYGWYFCVRSLLEAGANVHCVNTWQTTCLATGFLKGHYGLCDYLLTEHKADINFQTDDGQTLVMLTVGLAISTSVVQQLEYVVNKHDADCTSIDGNGSNAFHYLAGNTSAQGLSHRDDETKKKFRENIFRIGQILFDHNCDPNQLNNKAQSPLMIALENGNSFLVDFFLNQVKIHINADISHDGKTLLHYFAINSDQYELIQTFIRLPVNDEMKSMGKIFDNHGRTPFHYCASKFDEFCRQNKSSASTDNLKKQYQSIVQMIEYCLESIQCDPDVQIESDNLPQKPTDEPMKDDDDDEEEEDSQSTPAEKLNFKHCPASIFSLLRTVSFVDSTAKHPLECFLRKTMKPNVLHHETHRTPLLEAIHLEQRQTSKLLIDHPSCDINLSTSTVPNERQQTPLMFACQTPFLFIVRCLIEQSQCDLFAYDEKHNQAIHYYLRASIRTKEYIDVLDRFLQRINATHLSDPGEHQRTPIHVAVYHNLGTIDANTDVEQRLIQSGSDFMAKDDQGNLPLHNVFLNNTAGNDPVELCNLLVKAMKYKALDTTNNQGYTPLHLAVIQCSTVCVMILQKYNASLFIENKLSNSIIGTCIASGHLNLFITFLQQPIDIDLSKLHRLPIDQSSTNTGKCIKKTNAPVTWKWKCAEIDKQREFDEHPLIYFIIERDWQGALSMILDDIERFQLTYLQILEAAIFHKKLNLVLRILLRVNNDEHLIRERNSHQQNLFHLLANMNHYDEHLFQEILVYLHQNHLDWNLSDEFGSYSLHYACVKQNFVFIDFLREHYSTRVNFKQTDGTGNTAIALLFWSLPYQTTFPIEQIRRLITSGDQLDCLCNYENEKLIDPLSFGYLHPQDQDKRYPSDNLNPRTSPLIHAIVHRNFPLTKLLLELNANVNYPDEQKRTPLMHAVRQNDIHLVKLLLNKTYSPPSDQTNNQSEQLRPKLRAGNFFLGDTNSATASEMDEDENEDDNAESQATPPSKPFEKTSSIDVNATDRSGFTCIHHLVQPFPDGSFGNNLELLRLLHSCGASLTVADFRDLSPLQYSLKNNCPHISKELILLINNNRTKPKEGQVERFRVNDPNRNLLDRPDFYSDAQQFIEQYNSSHPPAKSLPVYTVDRSSGMSSTGEILLDTDTNQPYDVRLTKVDVSYGTHGLYNFYRMQIIRHKSKTNLYFLFTRWGRIGDGEGQHQLTPFSSLDECRKEFAKVFREKTANLWANANQFEVKPKKYTLVPLDQRELNSAIDIPIAFDRLHAEHEHPPSKLHGSVYKDLMRTLLSRQAIRSNTHHTQLDAEGMPVSQLTREQLQKARDQLLKIKEIIEKKDQLQVSRAQARTAEHKDQVKLLLQSIYEYTNEYYTLLPLNGYADEKLSIIDNSQSWQQQEKILNDIFELELSYKILLAAQANLKQSSPLDYLYQSIHCQFEAINRNDVESQLIARYIWASAPDIQIEHVFKIARSDEDQTLNDCQIDNHYLLWHGTNICNLISIMTRGLLVGTFTATATGSLFGKGIYTADTFAKSLAYCSGVQENGSERCFMLLCEVALGNIKEVDLHNNEDGDKPLDLNIFQSRKGIGRQIPDPNSTVTRNYGVQMPLGSLIHNENVAGRWNSLNYNEYIVYDEAQVALRYLVQFRR